MVGVGPIWRPESNPNKPKQASQIFEIGNRMIPYELNAKGGVCFLVLGTKTTQITKTPTNTHIMYVKR